MKFQMKPFLSLCMEHQEYLLDWLIKITEEVYGAENVVSTKTYMYAVGKSPILLTAHLDTVHKKLPTKNAIWMTVDGKKIQSDVGIGGDDRCGVYAILAVLGHLIENDHEDLLPSVLFTTDEECVKKSSTEAANAMVADAKFDHEALHCVITADRQDNSAINAGKQDAVYYQCDNKEFEDFITGYEFKTATGRGSDITRICPILKRAGVNLGCGYKNEHTDKECVHVDGLMYTCERIYKIISEQKSKVFAWIGKDDKLKGGGASSANYSSAMQDKFTQTK